MSWIRVLFVCTAVYLYSLMFKYFYKLHTSRGKLFLSLDTFICIYSYDENTDCSSKNFFMTVWVHVKHWSQSPWNEVSQIKYCFSLPDGYFLPHIRLLIQHLQDFVLQLFYSICFSFFLYWICVENEFKT